MNLYMYYSCFYTQFYVISLLYNVCVGGCGSMEMLIHLFLGCGVQGQLKGRATQARALGLKILDEKKAYKKLIWL